MSALNKRFALFLVAALVFCAVSFVSGAWLGSEEKFEAQKVQLQYLWEDVQSAAGVYPLEVNDTSVFDSSRVDMYMRTFPDSDTSMYGEIGIPWDAYQRYTVERKGDDLMALRIYKYAYTIDPMYVSVDTYVLFYDPEALQALQEIQHSSTPISMVHIYAPEGSQAYTLQKIDFEDGGIYYQRNKEALYNRPEWLKQNKLPNIPPDEIKLMPW